MAQKEMEDWHDKAEDIRRLDAEGKIKATLYDVPLYSQGSLNLCWAFVQVMMEEIGKENKLSQADARQRAIDIAKAKYGPIDWNKGCRVVHTGSMSINVDLMDGLKYGPIIAIYASYNEEVVRSGHEVAVTGYVEAPGHEGLVLTNNPWGDSNVQTLSDFKNGIPRDTSGMKLESYLLTR